MRETTPTAFFVSSTRHHSQGIDDHRREQGISASRTHRWGSVTGSSTAWREAPLRGCLIIERNYNQPQRAGSPYTESAFKSLQPHLAQAPGPMVYYHVSPRVSAPVDSKPNGGTTQAPTPLARHSNLMPHLLPGPTIDHTRAAGRTEFSVPASMETAHIYRRTGPMSRLPS